MENPTDETLSQTFDNVHKEFTEINCSQEPSTSPKLQDTIRKTITKLEKLTLNVSAVDMFSKNENYNELDPHTMKFLLLPYMLGVLWQINTREDRKNICEMSQIYFKDFLKRCRDYDFIQEPDVEEDEDGVVKKPKPLTPAEKRDRKIRKLKENKEYDAKIAVMQKWTPEEEESDSHQVKEIYIALVRKAINDSEDQLQSIEMEMQLINFGEKSKGEGESENAAPQRRPPPFKPFIITKDKVQKEVYGVGYPSLPVMTVEELYEQRIASGEWGPPPAGGTTFPNPEDLDEDIRADRLEEQDDEDEINRKRQYDEYKDDHRRGWGNRFNRS